MQNNFQFKYGFLVKDYSRIPNDDPCHGGSQGYLEEEALCTRNNTALTPDAWGTEAWLLSLSLHLKNNNVCTEYIWYVVYPFQKTLYTSFTI